MEVGKAVNPVNDRQLIVVFLGTVLILALTFFISYVQVGTAEQRIIETCKEAR